MIKVIIADDHAIVRTGLQLIFDSTPDLIVEDEAANGIELLRKVKTKDYDVVILDISMPGKDAFDTLKELTNLKPKLPVIIFTVNPEDTHAIRMFKNGASAYINKESNPELLIEVIREVVAGKKYYTPKQTKLMGDFLCNSDNKQENSYESLTDREFQIMTLLASGMKKGEIAANLSLSKNTISNHRNNILKKLNLTNNSELTRYAIQHGIIK